MIPAGLACRARDRALPVGPKAAGHGAATGIQACQHGANVGQAVTVPKSDSESIPFTGMPVAPSPSRTWAGVTQTAKCSGYR